MTGQPTNEKLWRSLWTGDPPSKVHRARRIFRHIPSAPRCKLCCAPFRGIGGPIMRLLGCAPSPRNPNFCNTCGVFAATHPGGAEVELSVLFADLRGSTAMAEQMAPAAFKEQLSGFHSVATNVLIDAEAMLDKIVGDEVGGLFLPIIAGRQHSRSAIIAALDLIKAVDRKVGLPVGVGVHTGIAYVGTVEGAGGSLRDIAAVGDTVNTTSRLASAAAAGEVLVSEAAYQASGLNLNDPPRRMLELKGKREQFAARVLSAAALRAPGQSGSSPA
jgi:adenylate cyclase